MHGAGSRTVRRRRNHRDCTDAVIDAYAGRILGWECSTSKTTAFVESAIRQAAVIRAREGHPLVGNTIHHSDAGSQYTAWRLGDTLMLSGMVPSIGSVGGAYDNALAETTIGLYKTEAVRDDSPFRRGPLHRLADVELLTADWVGWFNNTRLMHRLGSKPPVEFEADYYADLTQQPAGVGRPVRTRPGAIQTAPGSSMIGVSVGGARYGDPQVRHRAG
ncbi:hypothetical protein EBN03_20655 [Nocardia stercoris]|uniref:Integrase catalytic domain-containing protein n=1 Tax=Nocardia stercoris TaxID=2483361 RepID=A0A3M2L193_9NOCA|nr:hypothetical protein EBN03_20655 [Nocardia stercoris]